MESLFTYILKMVPFSIPGSLDEIRLKFDFEYYVDQKIIIPNQPDFQKYSITTKHRGVIQTIQDSKFCVIKAYR